MKKPDAWPPCVYTEIQAVITGQLVGLDVKTGDIRKG
jgi:hypothetical protein